MTPEMQFRCLLVCSDPAVYSTMDRVLQSFSIAVDPCLPGNRSLKVLEERNHDLVVIDCHKEIYAELLQKVTSLTNRPKPTVVLISEQEFNRLGLHVFLRRPVTDWSATEALKSAYSRMLLNHRLRARHALYERVEAQDKLGNTYRVIVTDIGEGGFGLRANGLSVGTSLSLRIPLQGLPGPLRIQGRVVWTRDYGVAGCEMVSMPPVDRELLRDWLKNRIRVRMPLISV